ncbi:MAG: DUF58 domain-containing protein [Gemmatimonadaceae bacterium]|jgi:uncharacterized protein (DUF58 family)|nr:DUF58 domain-containing protein [Gemmatimonadaceae bacterium]
MTERVTLDPATLARIGNLELVARWVVEGFISGLHRSPHLGFSTDFAEHRPYVPGDDIRHVDWRVFARTERTYLKTYEADTNTNMTVLLDASASMGYAHGGLTKLEYARLAAATLAWFSRRQRDRVGLVTFADDVRAVVPPSARHLPNVLHQLERTTASGGGPLARPMAKVAQLHPRRGLFVLLSDLYEPAPAVARALSPLTGAGHDVIVLQVLDAAERSFPFDDATTFRDLESGERMPVTPARMRARYVAAMDAHVSAMRAALGGGRVDYHLVDTSQPLERVLFDVLLRREFLRTAS